MGKYKWQTVSKDKKRVVVKNDKGKQKTLLTPTGKCAKYKAELENGIRITNDGKRKRDQNQNVIPLTEAQKAYRFGYRQALGEQAAIHKKKNK